MVLSNFERKTFSCIIFAYDDQGIQVLIDHFNRDFPSVSPMSATSASPGNLSELQTLSPTPHLLNQKAGSEAQHTDLTNPPGDSDVYEHLGTTDFQH